MNIEERKKTVKVGYKIFTFKKQKSKNVKEIDEKNQDDLFQEIKNKGGDFYVSGSDFGFPDVKVKTSISYVEDGFNLLREMDKSEIFNILISIYKAYKNKSSDTLYKCNDTWQNFCCDIVLFYCCRFMVDKEFQIPVIPPTKDLYEKFDEKLKELN